MPARENKSGTILFRLRYVPYATATSEKFTSVLAPIKPQPPWPIAAERILIISTMSEPITGPVRIPMRGVKFICTPPAIGMST